VSIIPVDTRGNNLKVLYLPTVSTNQGRFLLFKDYYGTASNSSFTISTTGTDLIDDYNSLLTFSNAFGSVSLLADGGSAWRTIGMYDGLSTPAEEGGFNLNTIAGLVMWNDATSYTSTQTLTTWVNKASITTYTVNCTGSVVMNGLNSLPIIRFTTSTQWRITPNLNLLTYTLFWVGRQRGGTNGRVLMSPANNQLFGYWGGGKKRLYIDDNPNLLGGVGSDSVWDMISHSRTAGSAYTFNWDGSLLYSGGSSSGNGMVDLAINTVYEFSDCDAAEIVLYNVVLSTTNIQKIEGYLAWKWGLQANLPSNHPHKSAPP